MRHSHAHGQLKDLRNAIRLRQFARRMQSLQIPFRERWESDTDSLRSKIANILSIAQQLGKCMRQPWLCLRCASGESCSFREIIWRDRKQWWWSFNGFCWQGLRHSGCLVKPFKQLLQDVPYLEGEIRRHRPYAPNAPHQRRRKHQRDRINDWRLQTWWKAYSFLLHHVEWDLELCGWIRECLREYSQDLLEGQRWRPNGRALELPGPQHQRLCRCAPRISIHNQRLYQLATLAVKDRRGWRTTPCHY